MCSKAYDAHDVAAATPFLVLGCLGVLLVSTHMCVHKGTVLLVLVGRFLLCYCCFWAGRQKPFKISYTFVYRVIQMWWCW